MTALLRIPLQLALLCSISFSMAQRPVSLVHSGHVAVQVQEPSDMAYVPGTHPPQFLVVSDNGYVARIHADGSLIERSGEVAYDLEGILLHGDQLLVVDERTRRILWLDSAEHTVTRRLTFPYGGGRNKGYEAILWNPTKHRYVLITERDPILITELDSAFRVVNEMDMDRSIRDISSATWHAGSPWLLSDMDRLLMRCDPTDYRILERWSLPVLNPEGFAFDAEGTLYVLSDDMQRLYTFPFPPRP